MSGESSAASFRRDLRTVAYAGLALIGLMLASLGSAYLKLGAANLAIGLGIAALKTAIVLWWFMRLRAEGAAVRLAAGTAVFLLVVLFTLSGIDYATRVDEPARVQAPSQLQPIAGRAR